MPHQNGTVHDPASLVDPGHTAVIQEFRRWLDDTSIDGYCLQRDSHAAQPEMFPRFLPDGQLQEFFRERNRLEAILNAVFGPGYVFSADPEQILDKYSKVFAVLLSINHGQYIQYCVQYDSLSDLHLPFSVEPPDFPKSANGELFKSFKDAQWRFCAPVLTYSRLQNFTPERILPIVRREKIGSGGSAATYKIEIHASHNQLRRHSRPELVRESPDRLSHTFVLKTFHSHTTDQERETELRNFVYLRHGASHSDGLVRFFGSYRHGNSFNIILEWANGGTLEDYFRRVQNPSKGPDIVTFWESLLKIAGGLCEIQGVRLKGIEENQKLQGFHQDIKPQNILCANFNEADPYRCEFKLADLGLGHFTTNLYDDDAGGTRTYGPPECYIFDELFARSPRKVSELVDVFSLGCVLSMSAKWIVDGYKGIQDYEKARANEQGEIRGFRSPGCFHDGHMVLQSVIEAHYSINENGSKSDNVTEQILELVNKMLWEAQQRPSASHVYANLQQELRRSKGELAERLAGRRDAKSPAHLEYRTNSAGDLQQAQSPGSSSEEKTSLGHLHHHPRFGAGAHENQLFANDPDINNLGRRADTFGTVASLGISRTSTLKPDGVDQQTGPSLDRTNFPLQGNLPNAVLGLNERIPDRRKTMPVRLPDAQSWRQNMTSVGSPTAHNARESYLGSEKNTQDAHADVSTNSYHLSTPNLPSAISEPHKMPVDSSILQDPFSIDAKKAPMTSDILPVAVPNGDLPYGRFNSGRNKRSNPPDQPTRPELPLERALQWRERHKQSERMTALPDGDDSWCLREVERRHQIFLIDNSMSMRKYWPDLIKLLNLLVYMVQASDEDGVEIYTTDGLEHTKARKWDAPSKICDFAKKHDPKASTTITNIYKSLDYILRKQRKRIENDAGRTKLSKFLSKKLRPLTLTVLTDGVWQPNTAADVPINETMNTLIDNNRKIDEVGIQFIQFGDSESGKEMLTFLDDELKRDHNNVKWDIVDREDWNGNVWKMLLGSINRWFDWSG